jgi:hypothetical protein
MSILKKNSVNQSEIDAGGDVIAGNKITKNYYDSPTIFNEDLTLKRLLAEHEREKELDCEYREFSDQLNKFFSKKITQKQRNLESKLIDGNREYLIEYAMDAKERFTKKVQKYGLYKSAQDVFTYLLTNIRSAFMQEVCSMIQSGDFKNHQIDEIVTEKIIKPFLYTVQHSSLNIDQDELYGVLYFLTGNCYIEWD